MPMGKPEISLIIPLYNAERTIDSLIDSIRNQTFDYFEAIFVNDGSTDSCVDKVADAAIRDERFRLIVQENAGPGAARNKGMDVARGRYIMFADCDDELAPNAMKHAYGRAEDTQAEIVVFQARHKDDSTGQTCTSPDRWDPRLFPDVFAGIDCPDHLFSQFRNWPWDKLFRRDFLQRNHLRFPELYRTEDLPFTCGALAVANRIAPLDEELYLYRTGNAASSTQTRDAHPLDFLWACRDFHAFLSDHGLMETFRTDYTRWIGMCVYVNLVELRTFTAFHTVFDALRHGGLQDFELLGRSDDEFLNPLHGQVVRAIDEQDFEHFLFDLWRLDADKALAYDSMEAELDSVMNSTSLKVGRALVGAPRTVLGALFNR